MTPSNPVPKFQKQLNRHFPEIGVIGDCFRTCIACLMGLEASEVPHFYESWLNEDATNQYLAAKDWLNGRGYTLEGTEYFPKPDTDIDQLLNLIGKTYPDEYYMFSGDSKTGCEHVVICYNDKIVWDTSQDNSGIVSPFKETNSYYVERLIKICY